MISRRSVLAASGSLFLSTLVGQRRGHAAETAILTEDGLYRQPWFLESFLELKYDLDAAGQAGKRLVVMWELRGCPYCKETHLVNFARPDITAYVREHFDVLQLNLIGSRETTDFDGSRLYEKALAERYGVRFTPTFQFFPPTSEGLDRKKPKEREVARAQGYLKPDQFLAMFRFVVEEAYETMALPEYLKQQTG
jgi:thioredoxin-related protein